MFGLQAHAEVEFELLEGAMLALKTLNGLNMQGQAIKVTLFPLFLLLSVTYSLYTAVKVILKTAVSPTFLLVRASSRSRGLFMSQCWTWI